MSLTGKCLLFAFLGLLVAYLFLDFFESGVQHLANFVPLSFESLRRRFLHSLNCTHYLIVSEENLFGVDRVHIEFFSHVTRFASVKLVVDIRTAELARLTPLHVCRLALRDGPAVRHLDPLHEPERIRRPLRNLGVDIIDGLPVLLLPPNIVLLLPDQLLFQYLGLLDRFVILPLQLLLAHLRRVRREA